LKPSTPIIPAKPTLSPLSILFSDKRQWREYFPFSEERGVLTYLGRVALYHGLKALALPRGSTILVPSYHEGVEIATILAAGYKVRYYRVTRELKVDLRHAEEQLNSSVSALYIIHYFGFAQPLQLIRAFCNEKGLKLIEDCALALFCRDGDTWLGSLGDMALFSLYKTHPLPGLGYLLTKEPVSLEGLHPPSLSSTVIQTLVIFRSYLRASRLAFLERWFTSGKRWLTRTTSLDVAQTINPEEGKWDTCMADLGVSQWSAYLLRTVIPAQIIRRRRHNFQLLASRLRNRVTTPFPELPDGICPLFLPVLVENKRAVKEGLERLGVECIDFWSQTHPTCPPDLTAEISEWRNQCLALPNHQSLNQRQIDRTADALLSVL
jgi:dTDP-4-amino-4,6-dideoxygalactose transaminase